MCNRCNCGCGSNRMWGGCGCGTNRYGYEYGCNNSCGDSAWYEAERLMRRAEMRRCREDRCAREFIRCMKNTHCGF